MGQGLFILLCVIALTIGARARNSKPASPKSIKNRKKFKRVLSISALVLIALVLMLFIPAIYQEIRIAIDTRFTVEAYLSIGVIVVGIFTFVAILRILKQKDY